MSASRDDVAAIGMDALIRILREHGSPPSAAYVLSRLQSEHGLALHHALDVLGMATTRGVITSCGPHLVLHSLFRQPLTTAAAKEEFLEHVRARANERAAKVAEEARLAACEMVARVEHRLALGESVYGDQSLDAEMEALIDERIEELADVIGWTCVAYMADARRKQRLSDAAMEGA
mgnify:CR=1 FL=1